MGHGRHWRKKWDSDWKHHFLRYPPRSIGYCVILLSRTHSVRVVICKYSKSADLVWFEVYRNVISRVSFQSHRCKLNEPLRSNETHFSPIRLRHRILAGVALNWSGVTKTRNSETTKQTANCVRSEWQTTAASGSCHLLIGSRSLKHKNRTRAENDRKITLKECFCAIPNAHISLRTERPFNIHFWWTSVGDTYFRRGEQTY